MCPVLALGPGSLRCIVIDYMIVIIIIAKISLSCYDCSIVVKSVQIVYNGSCFARYQKCELLQCYNIAVFFCRDKHTYGLKYKSCLIQLFVPTEECILLAISLIHAVTL